VLLILSSTSDRHFPEGSDKYGGVRSMWRGMIRTETESIAWISRMRGGCRSRWSCRSSNRHNMLRIHLRMPLRPARRPIRRRRGDRARQRTCPNSQSATRTDADMRSYFTHDREMSFKRETAIRRKISVVMFALLLATGGVLGLASSAAASAPSSPGISGGSVDINGWCASRFGAAWHGELVAPNVYGWRCQYGQDPYGREAVDMAAACRRTYGPQSTTGFTNYSNPYSWYCT
jgi:hypothetical protein